MRSQSGKIANLYKGIVNALSPGISARLQKIFVYKQVISHIKVKFDLTKSQSSHAKNFLSLEILNNKRHLRHFGISIYTLHQNVGCKLK